MIGLEAKAVEVLDREGWIAASIPCLACHKYSSEMFINVQFGGYGYKKDGATQTDIESLWFCVINPTGNAHQTLKELLDTLKINRVEIFGATYDSVFTSGRCPHFLDRKLQNFKSVLIYYKEL